MRVSVNEGKTAPRLLQCLSTSWSAELGNGSSLEAKALLLVLFSIRLAPHTRSNASCQLVSLNPPMPLDVDTFLVEDSKGTKSA
jgi:hypothetical protein